MWAPRSSLALFEPFVFLAPNPRGALKAER